MEGLEVVEPWEETELNFVELKNLGGFFLIEGRTLFIAPTFLEVLGTGAKTLF